MSGNLDGKMRKMDSWIDRWIDIWINNLMDGVRNRTQGSGCADGKRIGNVG